MVCWVHSSEIPHSGDFNEYTYCTFSWQSIKRNPKIYLNICSLELSKEFRKGLKQQFELAKVNEPPNGVRVIEVLLVLVLKCKQPLLLVCLKHCWMSCKNYGLWSDVLRSLHFLLKTVFHNIVWVIIWEKPLAINISLRQIVQRKHIFKSYSQHGYPTNQRWSCNSFSSSWCLP